MKLLAKLSLPLEIIALLGTLFGLFLKVMHLPGGAMILLLSMTLLALVYFFRAFIPTDAPPQRSPIKATCMDL
ncbi:MAG: hypothetical protein WDO15_10885 [Bacteroidota bacterium]